MRLTSGRFALLFLVAGAGCAGSAPPAAPEAASSGAAATYLLITSFAGPSGTSEASHLAASRTLDDQGGEMCAGRIEEAAFDRIAAAVAEARSPEPVADIPFEGGLVLVRPDGTSTPPETYTFADTVLFSARSADGRWLAFDGGSTVRDVDGQLYDLGVDGFEAAHRAVLTALIDSDGCPGSTERFRRWLDPS